VLLLVCTVVLLLLRGGITALILARPLLQVLCTVARRRCQIAWDKVSGSGCNQQLAVVGAARGHT
jgi:hypothetical protein